MFSRIKFFAAQSWLLLAASFVFGLLLAVTHYAWSPKIAENKSNKFLEKAQTLLPDATAFTPLSDTVTFTSDGGESISVDIQKGTDASNAVAGWAFECSGSGFADKITLVVAVNADFTKLAGYDVLSSAETTGYGDKIKESYFKNQFIGAPAARLKLEKIGDAALIDDTIVAISGATVTSDAMVSIFNTYVEPVKQAMQQKGLLK